jgi:hypothetical protein
MFFVSQNKKDDMIRRTQKNAVDIAKQINSMYLSTETSCFMENYTLERKLNAALANCRVAVKTPLYLDIRVDLSETNETANNGSGGVLLLPPFPSSSYIPFNPGTRKLEMSPIYFLYELLDDDEALCILRERFGLPMGIAICVRRAIFVVFHVKAKQSLSLLNDPG